MNLTMTGVDERVTLEELGAMASWKDVEIGFLYTFEPEGRPRYPSRDWLRAALTRFRDGGGRAALHVCGGRARQMLLEGQIDDLVAPVDRIQINGILDPNDVARACDLYPTKQVITQHTPRNASLVSQVHRPNHALLVDGSGGRGLVPTHWSRPDTSKAVGFAGGLGPDNLAEHLAEIQKVACPSAWVDMEAQLRTEDWFDVDRAARVATLFRDFKAL